MTTNGHQNSPPKYKCEMCDTTCSKKTEWERHINTAKHKNNENGEISNGGLSKFICNCGKIYKERSGLWRHEKKCTYEEPITQLTKEDNPVELAFLSNLVLEVVKSNAELMKQNQEFQKQMFDMCKNNNHFTT